MYDFICSDATTVSLGDALTRRGQRLCGRLVVPGSNAHVATTLVMGEAEGPTLLVSAGVHGAEYVGIGAAGLLAQRTQPSELAGTLIVLHCCNLGAFLNHVIDVMPEDGLNLNRAFPTTDADTPSQCMARFIEGIACSYADAHLDVHSGDAHQDLLPHCYYSANPAFGDTARRSHELALSLGLPFAVATLGTRCVYQNANWRGVPSVLTEMGRQGVYDPELADQYAVSLMRGLAHLGMLRQPPGRAPRTADLLTASYPEAPMEGCWHPLVKVGDRVKTGQLMGTIRSFFGDELARIEAQQDGVVLYLTTALSTRKGAELLAYGA
ncbi:hypothetical protein HLV37_03890 [Eggerthellaceae bacterium zg-1084]|uniref:succinylglutamate desuccinylase/aspartoacylase family protein n=1 Tax=Berryella wangjianweii TaxID=2734634 RepID=UPI001553DFB7|nr:succinylglutamate desuccinylase/aspartoacylase family protein [Berryella wangjianweii]NPD31008.1 hypothetical protein [Berryella wangjianweii]